MRPKPTSQRAQKKIFRFELAGLADLAYPLVKLGEKIDWAVLEEPLARKFDGKTGAPGMNPRQMVGLQYLRYQYNLRYWSVLARWVENPYWRQFRGRQFFEHEMPIDPSSITRWRKRSG
jgi:IS5 family transposase